MIAVLLMTLLGAVGALAMMCCGRALRLVCCPCLGFLPGRTSAVPVSRYGPVQKHS